MATRKKAKKSSAKKAVARPSRKQAPKKKPARKKAGKRAGEKAAAKGRRPSQAPRARRPAAAPSKAAVPGRPAGVPDGYHSVTPYLTVRGGAHALSFYQKAFGAKTIGQLMMPDRKVAHAEIQIGNSRIMLADEMPEFGNQSPDSLGGTPAGLCIYVPDCDAVINRAVANGARVEKPATDEFYGDRTGTVVDPFGHRWTLATRKEELSFPEMQKRMEAMFSSPS